MSCIYKERLFLTFLDHTQRRITVTRTRVDEWAARRRDLYRTTHSSHNRHPCPRSDSNPQFQQASGLRARGHWDRLCGKIEINKCRDVSVWLSWRSWPNTDGCHNSLKLLVSTPLCQLEGRFCRDQHVLACWKFLLHKHKPVLACSQQRTTEASLTAVCLSVCLPICKNSSSAERICIKFKTGRFCQKIVDQCSTEDVIKISEKLLNY